MDLDLVCVFIQVMQQGLRFKYLWARPREFIFPEFRGAQLMKQVRTCMMHFKPPIRCMSILGKPHGERNIQYWPERDEIMWE